MLEQNNGSTWGYVLFFLVLLWMFGGGNARAFGWGGCDWTSDRHNHQTERDALNLGRTIVEQNAATAQKLSEMAYAQEAQTARILEGQKDLYIRDLERAATNLFVTGQTNAINQRIDAMQAAGALQRQSDTAHLDSRLDMIQATMLQKPPFVPFGGLPVVGCANNPCSPCGCGTV